MKVLCFEIAYVGFGATGWKKVAKTGDLISAIRTLRQEVKGTGLMQAKEIVEDYMSKHKITRFISNGY